MDRAELQNAGIVVFSSTFEPGKQLEGLGGIAALLRYHIG
jgi:protein pelota